jgi:hypothetical protein
MPGKKIAVSVLVNNDTLGGRLADMLAAYAYDWWLQTENFGADSQASEDTVRPMKAGSRGSPEAAAGKKSGSYKTVC